MTAPASSQSTQPFGEYTPGTRVRDARPILMRTKANVWEATEALRSRLHDAIEAECRERGIEALVLQSPRYVQPAWVKFESWVRADDPTLTHRSSMTITLTAVPYHRFETIYRVEFEWQGSKRAVDQLHTLDESMVRRFVQRLMSTRETSFVSDQARALAKELKRNQLRQQTLHFWKPRNKITTFRRDWMRLTGALLIVAPIVLLPMVVMSVSGGFVPGLDGGTDPTPMAMLASLLSFVAGALLLRRADTAARSVRSPGRPVSEPRQLVRLDSWQTVVFGAGRDVADLTVRVMYLLQAGTTQKFHSSVERIWYWGLEGTESREQIVLSFGRALVFLQIFAYGGDLYVGWDAQMNLGQWVERKLGSGVERETGERIDLMTVESGWQATNEYDLIDLNCLAEWTHAQLTQVLKLYLKERQIDQEIDFQIIRGDRATMKDAQQETKKKRTFLRKD